MLPIFDMFNGEVRTWSIPCFYLEVDRPIDWHDPKLHDHLGWPRPGHPDSICQSPWEYHAGALSPDTFWQYVDMDKASRIHLTSDYEWYEQIEIELDDVDEEGEPVNHAAIDTSGWVDDDEDWVVKLKFEPRLEQFAGAPKSFLFNAYATGGGRRDLVTRGNLLVFPG